jgi:arylamine N-acetyltransferase
MTNGWLERYLTLLDIKGRTPTLATLTELASAHRRIVFSNAASLQRKAATPDGPVPGMDSDSTLNAWQSEASGGVCYEVATMLEGLLGGLGFESYNVLGEIFEPRAHQANIVTVAGKRYLLDLGNGAPFYEPIPIDDGPYEIDFAGLGYRFDRQGPDGQLVQSRHIDGAWQPFALYEGEAATPTVRAEAFQLHHELPARSFVMASFTLVQVRDNDLLALRDHTFNHYKPGGRTTRELHGVDAYRGLIRDEFGLPNYPVDEALAAWTQVTGATI